jgi:hypothetical protein
MSVDFVLVGFYIPCDQILMAVTHQDFSVLLLLIKVFFSPIHWYHFLGLLQRCSYVCSHRLLHSLHLNFGDITSKLGGPTCLVWVLRSKYHAMTVVE